jgi:hypothetical protein
VAHVDDLVEPRPEKIVLPTVPPLLRKHRQSPIQALSETGNHNDSRESICKKTAPKSLETGKIESPEPRQNHCTARPYEFFTGDDLIRTRTGEGRTRAKLRGHHMGRPPKMTPSQKQEARRRRKDGESVADLARSYDVSPAAIYRAVGEKMGADHPPLTPFRNSQ